eukprot:2598949-Amphidinium_carterae.1
MSDHLLSVACKPAVAEEDLLGLAALAQAQTATPEDFPKEVSSDKCLRRQQSNSAHACDTDRRMHCECFLVGVLSILCGPSAFTLLFILQSCQKLLVLSFALLHASMAVDSRSPSGIQQEAGLSLAVSITPQGSRRRHPSLLSQ